MISKEWENRKALYGMLLTLWDFGLLSRGKTIMGGTANEYADRWGIK